MGRSTLTLVSLAFVSTLIKIALAVGADAPTETPPLPTPAQQEAERRRIHKTHEEWFDDWTGNEPEEMTQDQVMHWRTGSEWHWCRAQCTISTWSRDGKWYELQSSTDRPYSTSKTDNPNIEIIYHLIETPPPLIKSEEEMAEEVIDLGKPHDSFIEEGWGRGFNPHHYAQTLNKVLERRRRR